MPPEPAIVYRDFEITPSLVSYMRRTDWTWAHKDYDGAPDGNDNRIGQEATVEECKMAIDEWYLDNEDA